MASDNTYWENISRDIENDRNNQLRAREQEQEDLLEQKRQNLVNNQYAINKSFNDSFNGDFYANYAKQLMDYWRPDLDRQYKDAGRSLNYTFAESQPGGGSVGAEAAGRLKEAYDKALLSANDNATSQSNQLKQSVEGQRSSLLGSVSGDTDPSAVQSSVASTIGNIPRSANYSALGDIFSSLTGQYAIASQASNAGKPGWFGPSSGSSSGRTAERVYN